MPKRLNKENTRDANQLKREYPQHFGHIKCPLKVLQANGELLAKMWRDAGGRDVVVVMTGNK